MFFFFGSGTEGVRRFAVISLSLFNLSRMVSGAHWITDVAVGTMAAALITAGLWLYTPLKDFSIQSCTRKFDPVLNVIF